MAGLTERFNLQTLNAGDLFSTNGYKFTDADRQTIDRLLWLATGGHVHTGAAAGSADPDTAPALTQEETGGALPAGVRIYYKYTYVDVNGGESLPSPEAYIDTPAAITTPAAPSLVSATTGGTLEPGEYFYVLSAYSPTSTTETKALNFVNVTIPIGTSTNKVTLYLPSTPAGAEGFNVYRRRPGGARYLHIGTVATNVATPPTTFLDDGTVTEDCDRTIPSANTTNSSNVVTITLPGATPTVPVGYTWKIYRTFTTGSWNNSLLKWRVETTTETSGIVLPYYDDVGTTTFNGTPPTVNQQEFSQPTKVDLTDQAHVTGRLPLSSVSAFPVELVFSYEGAVAVGTGKNLWICEFPKARVLGCRASLGAGSTTTGSTVIVDVNKGTGATPVMTTIYTNQGSRPIVPIDGRRGVKTVPDIIEFEEGDCMTVDIDQAGGGTPTNLTVSILVMAYGWTDTASMVW